MEKLVKFSFFLSSPNKVQILWDQTDLKFIFNNSNHSHPPNPNTQKEVRQLNQFSKNPRKANINTLLSMFLAVCLAFINSGCLDNHHDRHVNLSLPQRDSKCWDQSSNIHKMFDVKQTKHKQILPPKKS